MRKPDFAYVKSKAQISCAVTSQPISVFAFATKIAQALYFLNTKFQAIRYRLSLHSLVCVGPGWNSKYRFSHVAARIIYYKIDICSVLLCRFFFCFFLFRNLRTQKNGSTFFFFKYTMGLIFPILIKTFSAIS